MDTQKFEVVSAQSGIAVKGEDIILSDSRLNSGRYIIDTISFKVLDVTDPTLYAEFSGHLAADDFVSPEKQPEAFLDISSVTGNHVEGDLNIKVITHPIDLDVLVNVSGDVLTVTAKLVAVRPKTHNKIPLW
ncbi:MAG: YceI family protein [Mucilaginibacter sp.]|nr:YceI family protein [Mucilaginibacter sp.]